MVSMTGRFPIEDVAPTVHGGEYPAKAVVGELVPIAAVSYREGHGALGLNVVWQGPDGDPRPFTRMTPGTMDHWHATIRPDAVGPWTFVVEAFADPYLSWRQAVTKKIEAGQGSRELANDLASGAAVLEREVVPDDRAAEVKAAADALRDSSLTLAERAFPALDLHELMWHHPVRELVTAGPARQILVDRPAALFSAWYEMFPRSEGAEVDRTGAPVKHGTFATASRRLPEIAAMGFDVVYLPPIHPIGRIHRKGRDNALVPRPDDVGSPWAIGSDEGGHDAIHPQLGTAADFRSFVATARSHGLEVALDLALQCAPDHPWVKQHPEWFTVLPDGSIAYAENPPKKYQDIYPLNFDRDPEGIREAVLRVVLHWVEQGVKIFRVDNPHTKPADFWHWLIWTVKDVDPDVLFLAEAFTRPAMMHTLAKIGFHQSYTYFTWRNGAQELEEYMLELSGEAAAYMRPNFFTNTPDILNEYLQHGGVPAFKIRAVLAAMLSPTWGIYSGYELCENVPIRPGSEEYMDSEKYQYRPRDWEAAARDGIGIADYITELNRIRRTHPALHRLRNLRFHGVDQPGLMCFSKRVADARPGPRDDTVLVVVNLDPYQTREATVWLDLPALGVDREFIVTDELTGESYRWGNANYVRLDPATRPAHVFSVTPQQ